MTDYTKAAFATPFRYIYVHDRGSVTLADDTATIPHNLGYKPYVKLAGIYPNGQYGSVANNGTVLDTDMSVLLFVSATDIQIEVFDNTFGSRSMTVFYKIYAEALT